MRQSFSPVEIDSSLLSDSERLPSFVIGMGDQFNALLAEHEKVLAELSWLKRQMFGQKSERFIPDVQQLGFALGVAQKPVVVSTQSIQYKRQSVQQKPEGHGRGLMPTHLPIEDVVIEPLEDVTGLERIGEEVSWEYDYEPGCLKIKRYRRPKYVRRGETEDAVLMAALPPRPIEKGNAGPGLMARVVVDKYLYHLPLDRQRRKFAVEDGVEIAESTLCDMVRQTAFWIGPLYTRLVGEVLSASYLQADETPIPVQVRTTKRKTHRGFFWVYRDPLTKVVIFDYRKGRGREGPTEMLKEFSGVLQVDGYEGYNQVIAQRGLVRAACMAHVRRKFEQAMESDSKRGEQALSAISAWFEEESRAKEAGLDFAQRLAMRREQVVSSMDAFQDWLKTEGANVLPKSPMGMAIAYALNQWPGFVPFMTDGRIEFSNNLIENAIRPVALGRKNYLFMGSHEAAQRTAVIYSLIATATAFKIDPFRYFKDLLTRLPAAKNTDIDKFLPQNWKSA